MERKPYILLVDDSESFLLSGGLALTRSGYQLQTARNGRRALELIHQNLDSPDPFDLIISDIVMPEMDGLQLCEALQAEGVRIPVLLVTGWTDRKARRLLQKKGCRDLLLKPFLLSDFLGRVEEILSRQGMAHRRLVSGGGYGAA